MDVADWTNMALETVRTVVRGFGIKLLAVDWLLIMAVVSADTNSGLLYTELSCGDIISVPRPTCVASPPNQTFTSSKFQCTTACNMLDNCGWLQFDEDVSCKLRKCCNTGTCRLFTYKPRLVINTTGCVPVWQNDRMPDSYDRIILCTPCDPNCASYCKTRGVGKCDQGCNAGYKWMSDFTCKACDFNCASGCNVTGPGKCDSACKSSNMLDIGFNCQSRQLHCDTATALKLSCAAGTISIGFAMYGREFVHFCTDYTGSDTYAPQDPPCSASNALNVVRQLCSGKNQCSIMANPTTFQGDPCPGFESYLDLSFKCSLP